jgi:hypothetical protein
MSKVNTISLSLSQINIWRSNGLWLCKIAMLFTLPESGAQSKESKDFAIVRTFLFVTAIAFVFLVCLLSLSGLCSLEL